MLKQTKGAISFLIAEYKAVLKNAALAAVMGAAASQASATAYVFNSPSEFNGAAVTELAAGDSWTFNGPGTNETDYEITLPDDKWLTVRGQITLNGTGTSLVGQMDSLDLFGSQARLTLNEGTSLQVGDSGFDVTVQNGAEIKATKAVLATGSSDYAVYNNGRIYLDNSVMGLNFLEVNGGFLYDRSASGDGYTQTDSGTASFVADNGTFVTINSGLLLYKGSVEVRNRSNVVAGGVAAGIDIEVYGDPSQNFSGSAVKGKIKVTGGSKFTVPERAKVEYYGEAKSYFNAIGDDVEEGSPDVASVSSVDNTRQFDIENGSSLTILDLGKLTLSQVNAIKQRLFLDPSKGTLAGYILVDDSGNVISGGDAGSTTPAIPDVIKYIFDDVGIYDGTTALVNQQVTGIHGDITGSKNFGSGVLASAETTVKVGSGSALSLNDASTNDGKFASTSDGAVANVSVGSNGYIQLRGDGQIGNISGDGSMQAENGVIKAGDVSVGAFNFTNGANVSVNSLSARSTDTASTITDSSATVSQDLTLGDVQLENARLAVGGNLNLTGTASLDPSYVYAGNINVGSTALLNVLGGTVVYDGTSDTSYAPASGTSALVLNKPLDLSAGGKVYINSSIENDSAPACSDLAKQITIADGELVVTSNGVSASGDGAVIKLASDDQVEIGDSGSIVLSGFKVSKSATFTLFDHATDVETSDIKSANVLYSASIDDAGQVVTYSLNNAGIAATSSTLIPSLSGAIVARALSDDSSSNYFDSTENSAVGFVTKFLENADSSSARSLNTLASYAFASNSAQNALASSEAGYGAVEERAGLRAQNSSSIGEVKGHDVTVWATPLYKHQSSDSFGFDGGGYGASTNLYGVAVGADRAFATSFRAGVAAHVGSGKSESEGDLDYVKDEFDFYGASLYGVYQSGRLSLLGDLGYTYVDNDSKGSGFKAGGFGSDVFTAGVSAKYAFEAGSVAIAPHLGVRYVSSHIDGYDVKCGGVKYMDVGSITQNVVKFPLGVSFSTEVKSGEWTVKPVGDITVTAAAGDRDVDSDVTLAGFNGFSVNGDVVDPVSARASVGLDAQMGQSLGLGFGLAYTGSKNLNEASVSGTIRYTF